MSLSSEAAIENYLRTSKALISNVKMTALHNNFYLQARTQADMKNKITSKVLTLSEKILTLINNSKTNSKCKINISKRMRKCLIAMAWGAISQTIVDIILVNLEMRMRK